MIMDEIRISPEREIFLQMVDLWQSMENNRPTERSEKARRWEVAITEYQKVMGYFKTFVLDNIELVADGNNLIDNNPPWAVTTGSSTYNGPPVQAYNVAKEIYSTLKPDEAINDTAWDDVNWDVLSDEALANFEAQLSSEAP